MLATAALSLPIMSTSAGAAGPHFMPATDQYFGSATENRAAFVPKAGGGVMLNNPGLVHVPPAIVPSRGYPHFSYPYLSRPFDPVLPSDPLAAATLGVSTVGAAQILPGAGMAMSTRVRPLGSHAPSRTDPGNLPDAVEILSASPADEGLAGYPAGPTMSGQGAIMLTGLAGVALLITARRPLRRRFS